MKQNAVYGITQPENKISMKQNAVYGITQPENEISMKQNAVYGMTPTTVRETFINTV